MPGLIFPHIAILELFEVQRHSVHTGHTLKELQEGRGAGKEGSGEGRKKKEKRKQKKRGQKGREGGREEGGRSASFPKSSSDQVFGSQTLLVPSIALSFYDS